MKITLSCPHSGIHRLLTSVWAKHTIQRVKGRQQFLAALNSGNTDVVVLSAFFKELEWIIETKYDGPTPVLVYVVDAISPATNRVRSDKEMSWFQALQDKPWFHAIGVLPCWPKRLSPKIEEFVPFVMDPAKYPVYRGARVEVLAANRHPEVRFASAQKQAGESPTGLKEYLEPLPWNTGKELCPSKNFNHVAFSNLFRDFRVLFYFADNLLTLVLWEAMTVGIPIVAFNQKAYADCRYLPVERFLPHHSLDRLEIHQKLRHFLDSPPERVHYDIPTLEEVRAQWDSIFTRIVL